LLLIKKDIHITVDVSTESERVVMDMEEGKTPDSGRTAGRAQTLNPRSERNNSDGGRGEGDAGPPFSLSRRAFLCGIGTVTLAAGTVGLSPLLGPERAEAVVRRVTPQRSYADARRRQGTAFRIRVNAAAEERKQAVIYHPTNGDLELYPNRIGNFSKTLPHDEWGEVEPAAFDALLKALDTGMFEDFEAIPAGSTPPGPLTNPMGGMAYNMEGPDSSGVGITPPPPLASAELAAQMAELYWTALLRDVPFTDWDADPMVQKACDDLSDNFSGYTGPRDPLTGKVTPQILCRVGYPGAMEGPMVSQFLLRPFLYDGIPVEPRIRALMPGADYMTEYQEWLAIQNGGIGQERETDPVLRYVRNCRDLAQVAGTDAIYSPYFRAALILSEIGALDDGNPYRGSARQGGFATFGLPNLLELVGLAHAAGHHAWWHKWLHLFLRPEAYGGLVHHVMTGGKDYPIHQDLLNSDVMYYIGNHNEARNEERGFGPGVRTYLLPTIFRRSGSPTHPSFPAGHALFSGACVTILKAWFKEEEEFPDPVMPNEDGTALVPYGGTLTIGGELNKLVHNIAIGRNMGGIHYRADGVEGNRLGEDVAIRLLRELRATYPEPFDGFSLRRFDGTQITV
jgi:hypothetical protein